MKNWTVGKRLTVGFTLVCMITIILGAFAIWGMKEAVTKALRIDKEYVSQVKVADEVLQNSLKTMLEIRGYSLTGEGEYLEKGRKHLEVLNRGITEAKNLSDKYPSLTKLKEGVSLAEKSVKEYESLLSQTVQFNEAIAQNRRSMEEAERVFLNQILLFLSNQYRILEEEVNKGISPEKLKERMNKIMWMNEVIDLGNAIIIANFKAQALRNFEILREGMKNFDAIEKKLEDIRKITYQDVNIKQIERIKESAATYKKAIDDLIKNWNSLEEVAKKRRISGDQVMNAADEVYKHAIEKISELTNKSVLELSRTSRILLIGSIGVLILSICIAFFITRSITLVLRESVNELKESAEQVASAAEQVSSASQSLAEGASQQAAGIEESSSAIEEMASMTKQNADNADQANTLAKQAAKSAQDAKNAMNKLLQQMEDIVHSSEETQKIVKTIDEIAFQTNLLALNAAVEAARAGEAGAGFAVVADEVRALAMRAAEAAKNTAALIEETIKKIREGSNVTRETNNAFGEVYGSVLKVVELVGEIAAASREQSEGINQISTAISEMDKVVQQTAASAEESAGAAEELSSQSAQLKHCVNLLIELVGGSNQKETGYGVKREASTKPKILKSLTALKLKEASKKTKETASGLPLKPGGREKEIAPDKVIPFDDEKGFKDF
ncbi:MAG: methyl-accepting chemotaxis protein [Syntrophobacterales bacterium]|nr:methyl-accepting chemotaxis protein [Syntrophobacterales bacterium]